MSSPPWPAREPVVRVRVSGLLFLLVALLARTLSLAGQTVSPAPARDSATESHFAAAQEAQRAKNYPAAEREYRAVLAVQPKFAEVHMNLGLLYQLQDRLPEAMLEFRRALKLKPALTGANFFLGVDHCKLGESLRAIPYLQAAAEAEPHRPDTWLWLATAEELAGQMEGEVETLRRALDLVPDNVDLLYLLGHSYERLGKTEVVHMDKIAPGSSRNEQLLAESYAASNEWPSAVIHFQNALAAAPNLAGLHLELGEVLLRAGRVSQAIPEFDAELRLDAKSLRALVRRGEAFLIQGNLDGALDDWRRSIEIDKTRAARILGLREAGFGDAALEQLSDGTREKIAHLAGELEKRNTAVAHFALAFLAAQSGDPSKTEAELALVSSASANPAMSGRCSETDLHRLLRDEQFSELAPCVDTVLASAAPAEVRIEVARALLDAGEYEPAFLILRALPAADRDSLEASFWRARCYEKLATAAYLRLYEADPNSYRLHQLMGDLAAAREDDGKAIDEYRIAVALKPSLPNLHDSLGHLLWKDLKIPEARVELEAELALNPHHAGALDDLGDTFLLEHQPAKALPYLLRALASDAENPDIHRDLGTAYSEMHDYPKAVEQLEIAVSDDHDGSVHYKLGRVYQSLGEKDNAAREFALSTSLNRESHNKLEKQTERLAQVTKSNPDP
jgi:tetratricopeptide (TPR) repeat protein